MLLLFALFALGPRLTVGVIEVEIACPGFVNLNGGNGALPYHVPAYEAAINDSNHLYAGVFRFSLALIIDNRSAGATMAANNAANLYYEDNAVNLLARWYYARDRRMDSVTGIITPGNRFLEWMNL